MSTSRNILNRVYVNGHMRDELRVISVTQRAGLSTPGTAVISAPYDKFGNYPLLDWIPIKIYLDWYGARKLKFTGYIWRRILSEAPGSRDAFYECVDGRVHLMHNPCARDYNVRSDKGNSYDTDENSGACQIAIDIINRFNAYAERATQYDFSALNKIYNGNEYQLRNTTVAQALDGIAQGNSQYSKPRFRVQYLEDRGYTGVNHGDIKISIFGIGYGKPVRVVLGSNPAKSFKAQRGGHPNVSEADQTQTIGDFFNNLIAEGDFKKVQTAMLLTPAWDESDPAVVQTVMKNRTKYCMPLINGQPNPYYQKKYEIIGKVWKINKVTLWDPITQAWKEFDPIFETYLVQNRGGVEEMTTKNPIPHFVVIGGAPAVSPGGEPGEPIYRAITQGYTILQGSFVEFAEPLFTLNYSVEAGFYYTFPDDICLVASVKDSLRVAYNTGKVGEAPYTVTRRLTRPLFQHWRIEDGWKIDPLTGEVTWVDDEVCRDDTSKLQSYALGYIKERFILENVYHFTLPHFTLNYEVGYRVESNYSEINHASIIEITYICWNGEKAVFETRIGVAGGQ